MRISSTGIEQGIIHPRYGMHSNCLDANGTCLLSIPLAFDELPPGTKSLALVVQDYDAIPCSGFSWIHWVVCNITGGELLEDASRKGGDFVEGATSWCSGHIVPAQSPVQCAHYFGMGPPDFDHEYDFDAYALDGMLELSKGFYLNELYHAMRGHILEKANLKAVYKCKP